MLIKTDVLHATNKYKDCISEIRTETNWIGTGLKNDKQTVQKNRFGETSTRSSTRIGSVANVT